MCVVRIEGDSDIKIMVGIKPPAVAGRAVDRPVAIDIYLLRGCLTRCSIIGDMRSESILHDHSAGLNPPRRVSHPHRHRAVRETKTMITALFEVRIAEPYEERVVVVAHAEEREELRL